MCLLFDEPVNGLDPEGHPLGPPLPPGPGGGGPDRVRVQPSDQRDVADCRPAGCDRPGPADRRDQRGRLRGQERRRSRQAASRRTRAAFTSALTAAGAKVGDGDGGSLTVEGLTAPQIGDLAARDGLRVHELTPITASLEDAFMELTQDEVEYRPSTMAGAAAAGEKE